MKTRPSINSHSHRETCFVQSVQAIAPVQLPQSLTMSTSMLSFSEFPDETPIPPLNRSLNSRRIFPILRCQRQRAEPAVCLLGVEGSRHSVFDSMPTIVSLSLMTNTYTLNRRAGVASQSIRRVRAGPICGRRRRQEYGLCRDT